MPQSRQSVPSAQALVAELGLPSSQNASDPQSGIPTHSLVQMQSGARGGGGGEGSGLKGGGCDGGIAMRDEG